MFSIVAVVAFNAYHGCQKCTVRGQRFEQFKTMSFPRTNAQKRSNESFRARTQIEHHHDSRSLIEFINEVDMIKDFPTSDPLHLLDLGVMRKCLIRWKDGTKSYKDHFKEADCNKINSLLRKIKNDMPSEIHRAIRDLNTLHFWKGTEFRTFLLYVGLVALECVLTKAEYEHFKLLSCSTILCSSDAYKTIVNSSILVDRLIDDYVEGYIDLYGEHTITSNVHNLCHIVDDVRRFGNLNTFSTYTFENCLQFIKQRKRSMNNPLQQIHRRIDEIESVEAFVIKEEDLQTLELKYALKIDKGRFQTVVFKNFRVCSRKISDSWFLDKSNRIIMFSYATEVEKKVILHGFEVIQKDDFFKTPFDSSKINIYVSSCHQMSETTCDTTDIKCKLIRLPFENEFVFQPLLHTL